MSVFARFLVEAGITNSTFSAIVRIAYFRAVTDGAVSAGARFANRRLNHSAIAAMTGLTRVQVRAFAKRGVLVHNAKQERLHRVVEGWTSDPSFQTASYTPRRLAIKAKRSGFSALVQKYGGDVSSRSILRELQRNGYASVDGGFVQLEKRVTRSRGEVRLRQLSQLLMRLITDFRAGDASASPFRSANYEIAYPATSAKGRILLQKRLTASLRTLLTDVQVAGIAASVEAPPGPRQKNRVTRTRLALITEDSSG